MAYQVIRDFHDKENERHLYEKGDPFPKEGKVSERRIKELSTANNDAKEPLIKEVEASQVEGTDEEPNGENNDSTGGAGEETEFPKHTGGGWFELSNGEKIQGKEEALAAEEELK
ncbi:hypothetical protein [Sediminibacillus massiliensis]|uniref:hypothetical protein n=1 Tax=Sediminibacillus massiliensis TaxID=1926277 RepID=UPI000988906F|nr:hypothetical protein [Sediminibacillus massiliensis]